MRGKGEKYPTLSAEQRVRFRDAVITSPGLDPTYVCPLCFGRRLTTDELVKYDDEAKDFVRYGTWVACHNDRVQWSVVHA